MAGNLGTTREAEAAPGTAELSATRWCPGPRQLPVDPWVRRLTLKKTTMWKLKLALEEA